MKNITVYTLVYNEEARIENLLKNLLWSDDIIIYDKSSTDKTRDIAAKYPCRVIRVPYFDTGSGHTKNIVNDAKNEWLLHLSCSDIIHPSLVSKMLNLINKNNFNYDVIAFPYVVGALGIFDKRSPWDSIPLKKYLFKKSVAVSSEIIHQELTFSSDKVYKMEKSRTEAVFHLTHENLDTFFERHIRYTKAEAKKYKTRTIGYWKCLGRFFAAIFWMIFYKRVLFMGWKGLALFFAFLSYFMMEFLFTWEKFDGKGKDVYDKLRDSMLKEWENNK